MGETTKNKEINPVFILGVQFHRKPINLDALAMLPNVDYDPANANFASIKLGDKISAKIFANGTVQILGKHSKRETNFYIDKLLDILISI